MRRMKDAPSHSRLQLAPHCLHVKRRIVARNTQVYASPFHQRSFNPMPSSPLLGLHDTISIITLHLQPGDIVRASKKAITKKATKSPRENKGSSKFHSSGTKVEMNDVMGGSFCSRVVTATVATTAAITVHRPPPAALSSRCANCQIKIMSLSVSRLVFLAS
ncbi:hypothetical protein E2C01_009145 [Portunus trituberculatus]|uniref:Uncharacterized protein n=1 Tax=Portunus trituberculatus TaxID=210409 RepID=A0A5B7D5P9_PORTR|nr:hypothetical protein [Portunus trituberculatus]